MKLYHYINPGFTFVDGYGVEHVEYIDIHILAEDTKEAYSKLFVYIIDTYRPFVSIASVQAEMRKESLEQLVLVI